MNIRESDEKLTHIQCDLCGYCCQQKGDYIPLTIFDLIRIYRGYSSGKIKNRLKFKVRMRYVGGIGDVMPKNRSFYKYSLLVEGWVPLPCLELPCRYLKTNMCGIHFFKPLICISFPYHLPLWKENDPCHIISELSKRKESGRKILVPKDAEKAIHLYPIALSATMYQMNLPIYSLDDTETRLVQKEGFRDLVEGSKRFSAESATLSQMANWVSKHFVTLVGRDHKLDEIQMRLARTLYKAVENPDFRLSNIALMQKLAYLHFTSRRKIEGLIDHFLSAGLSMSHPSA